MENWKKIVFRAAGFGGGFAVVAALILGIIVWCSSRPVKPKPWDTKSITAVFGNLSTEGTNHTVIYNYTLINNTDSDYSLQDDSTSHIGFKRMQTNALDFSDKDFIKPDFPIYIPAKSRVSIALHMPLPYESDVDLNSPTAVQHDYYTKLSHFVSDTISNVDGFVLMDDSSRYEIIFPNGWRDIGNRPLEVKASDTAPQSPQAP
jgi:hypothetical protein